MDNVKKQRDTKQRRLVYDAVKNRCDHPTADDIYEEIHRKDPKVSKGTVYRNLSILSENDDILDIKIKGADRYDSRLDLHCHVMCIKCGKVIDAPIEYSSENDSKVQNETGFQILRHRTIFEGICTKCKEEDNG